MSAVPAVIKLAHWRAVGLESCQSEVLDSFRQSPKQLSILAVTNYRTL